MADVALSANGPFEALAAAAAASPSALAGPRPESSHGWRSLCPEPEPGRVHHIGKYVVSRYLGHGAMGRVFLGVHPELQLQVAIKVIDGRHAADPRYRQQFLREARLASQINHPNVVRIYDADQDGDSCFMVQEYVDGGDLADLLGRTAAGGLPLHEALRLGTGVAAGLAAAERLQIVHRDIKPSNILITRAGEAKLADLGLARKIRHADSTLVDETISRPGSTVGTPAYMAPEQILATAGVDIRADIYSLGATLFEMVTGQPPFPGGSTEDILRRHLHDPVPDPRALSPGLPRRLARLIMRMLAKRPEDRPSSAASLLRELECLNQPYLQRRTLGWSVGLLLALVLIAGGLTLRHRGQDSGFSEAMALTASGKYEEAFPLLQAASRRRPHSPLARYVLGLCHYGLGHHEDARTIRDQLAASGAGTQYAGLLGGLLTLPSPDAAQPDPRQSTLEMICSLAAAAPAHAAEGDDWTSTATILVFQGLESRGQTPVAQVAASAWLSDLEASLVQRATFPVVDRAALDFILREMLLSQAGVVTHEARLTLGRLLPASVLVESSVNEQDGRTLSLRLVDVETSVLIGAFSRAALDGEPRQATLSGLAEELERCLALHARPQGLIATVAGKRAGVNIGRCHGLAVGQELTVYRPRKSFFSGHVRRGDAMARVRVEELDGFSATVSLHDAHTDVIPGMLVQASAP